MREVTRDSREARVVAASAVTGLLLGLSAGCGTRGIQTLADVDVVRATEPSDGSSVQPTPGSSGKMSCTPAMMGSAASSVGTATSGGKMSCSAEMMTPKR